MTEIILALHAAVIGARRLANNHQANVMPADGTVANLRLIAPPGRLPHEHRHMRKGLQKGGGELPPPTPAYR